MAAFHVLFQPSTQTLWSEGSSVISESSLTLNSSPLSLFQMEDSFWYFSSSSALAFDGNIIRVFSAPNIFDRDGGISR